MKIINKTSIVIINSKMDRIKARIQQKIADYPTSGLQDSTVSLAEQKKKSLLKMFDQFQLDQSVVSTDPVQIGRYNNKFEDLSYLTEARSKIDQLTLNNHRLQMQVNQSNKNLFAIKQMLDQERSRARGEEDILKSKHSKMMEEERKEFQARIQKNLKYIDQLLEQKSKFNERTETFLLDRKKLQKMLTDQRQKFKVEMKAKVDGVEAQEKDRRVKWEQNKITQLKETTIKGMEPQLNAIITRSRNEIRQTQQRCQKEKLSYREECYREFERKALQLKEESFREHESQKQKLRMQYSKKFKEQYDQLQVQYKNDKEKIRQTYKGDIEDLEFKRKNQQEEFMKKNRQVYDDYMGEVKRVRDDYEDRIRILEGSRQKFLEAEKEKLATKYEAQTKQEIQKYKKEQRQKIESAYAKLQEEYQKKREEEFNKMAIMNSELERDLEIKYDNKRKDQRKLFQEETRKLKRNVQVLEEKLQKQNKQSGNVAKQKGQFETLYLELKVTYDQVAQQLQETKLKVKELEKQLDTLTLNFGKQLESKLEVQKSAKEKELEKLRKIMQQQEQDRQLLSRSNANRQRESEKKWAQQMGEFQKRARKVLDKKEVDIQALKGQVKRLEEMSKAYEGMLQKQRQQLMTSLSK